MIVARSGKGVAAASGRRSGGDATLPAAEFFQEAMSEDPTMIEIEAQTAELRARIEKSIRQIRECALRLYAFANPAPTSQQN